MTPFQEITEEKKAAEARLLSAIHNILQDFKEETGCDVSDVNVYFQNIPTIGKSKPDTVLNTVEINVRI